ncbi:hypothetical protein QBC34DRAFT_11728 [Podospora aff. communis PSN243]|uniref:LysM domain-containing protein n=1 Tax=Podospora aff. communis PSN243 TaxID=3040156 RepID=A0AAV9H7A5_9PEZI|nr:hypothetical protein QBC34DRAFT_11728 [Podospora aff. communis PSN243]
MDACCTCATLLSAVPRVSDTEKPLPDNRQLTCCARVICGVCLHAGFPSYCLLFSIAPYSPAPRRRPPSEVSQKDRTDRSALPQKNFRFRSYCPYCQTSTPGGPSVLVQDPPSYSTSVATTPAGLLPSPPPYTLLATASTPQPSSSPSDQEKAALTACEAPGEDTLHFLDHSRDTVASLSLRYGVPADALRRANNIGSDHLLAGRRTVVIPGRYYRGGVSLSPRPVEGEEEEARKAKIRRWMMTCKVSDYEVAMLYLEQADYYFHDAVEAYFADEAWERDHPLENNGQGGTRKKIGGLSLARGKGVPRSLGVGKKGFWGNPG